MRKSQYLWSLVFLIVISGAGIESALSASVSSVEYAEELVQHGDETREFQRSLQCYQEALKIFQHHGKQRKALYTLLRIFHIYRTQEAHDAARAILEDALDIAKALNDKSIEGVVLKNFGDLLRAQCQLKKALERYQQALSIFKNLRQQEDIAETLDYEIATLASIGNTYAKLCWYPKAIQYYNNALTLLQQDEHLGQKAEILRDYGIASTRLGRYQEALDKTQEALKLFTDLEVFPQEQATVLTNLGGIYEGRGQNDSRWFLKSLAVYHEALELEQRPGVSRRSQAITLNNTGKALDLLGWKEKIPAYHRQALKYYQQALTLLPTGHPSSLQGRIRNNIGVAHLHLSFHEHAGQHLQKALDALLQALAIQENIQDRTWKWRTLSNLGWAYQLQKNQKKALEITQEAITTLEEIIESVRISEFKIGLRDQAQATYERAVLLSLETGRPELAFEFSERARARAFLDQLGNERLQTPAGEGNPFVEQQHEVQLTLAELESRLQSHYQQKQPQRQEIEQIQQQLKTERRHYEELLVQLKAANPEIYSLTRVDTLPLAGVQNKLPQGTTLLSYFVTSRKTLVWIISRETFRHVELPIGRQELASKIFKLRRIQTQHSGTALHLTELLEDLYQQMLLPVEPYLNTSTVGIIPHDVLHYLPFAALARPSSSREGNASPDYFGQTHTLFRLPSASVLQYFPETRPAARRSLLTMANSLFSRQTSLPGTVTEAQTLTRCYRRYYDVTECISDPKRQEATETRFKKLAGSHEIIHLAAHGQLMPEEPLFSRIVLSPDDKNDGNVEVKELYTLKLKPGSLVVLSACNTQLGQRSRGDDIIGLTRAFLHAGASSVIASLWKVDDRATCELMKHFYLHLAITHSPARALRIAQRTLRAQYPHPYYWAGFVLTGTP